MTLVGKFLTSEKLNKERLSPVDEAENFIKDANSENPILLPTVMESVTNQMRHHIRPSK
jgi:hypothetical protein